MDKITIERETLLPCPFCGDDGDKGRQEVTQMIEGRNKFARITCRACGAMCPEENWNRRAALAAQPADAQPTGQSPCARHCEAPAFEGEIRRLKREATIKDSLTIRPPAPAAVPLTDEQIDDICWNFNCSNTPLVEYDRLIARAIEAAHGIAAAGDKP